MNLIPPLVPIDLVLVFPLRVLNAADSIFLVDEESQFFEIRLEDGVRREGVWLAAKHRESDQGDICVNRLGINSL
jgi:hypothetical protein